MTSRLKAKLLAKRALFQRLNETSKGRRLQNGFTLIELLVVVVIIGILSGIAIPAFLQQANRAAAEKNNTLAMDAARACAAALVAGDTYTVPEASSDGAFGTCTAGDDNIISADTDPDKASIAEATVGSDGSVELTTRSTKN